MLRGGVVAAVGPLPRGVFLHRPPHAARLPWPSQKESWDQMAASARDAEQRLAAVQSDLAAQQKLNRKLTGQVKDKDTRIRTLETELEAARAEIRECARELCGVAARRC